MGTSQNHSLANQVDLNWQPLNEPGSGGLISSVSFNPTNPKHILIGGDMLGVGLSLDGGQSWQRPAGFTTSFEIEEFTWNPNNADVVWAATREGPYLSQDGGRTWQSKRQGMPAEFTNDAWLTSPIQRIIYGADGTLLAFGGNHREFSHINASTDATQNYGAVWESTNNGESWSIRGRINPADQGSGYNIKAVTYAADNQTLYAAVEAQGVYRSLDQGATWQPMNGGQFNDANDIAAHPSQPGTLWVSTETGLYKTVDGGATWFSINNGIDPSHIQGAWQVIEVAPSNPNVLMAGNHYSNALYRSQDGGNSWQQLENHPDTAFDEGITPHSLSFDPNDANRIIFGTFVAVFISEDQGNSWFDATSQRADVGANEWKGRGFSGWVSRNIEWNPYKPNQVVFQGMDEGTLWISEDLEGWRTLREQPNGEANPIEQFGGGWDVSFAADGQTIYTTLHQQYSDGDSNDRGIAKSLDGGKTWAYLSNQPGGIANKTDHAYEIHALPGNPNYVWVRVDQQLWQSQDGGSSWSRIHLNGANVVDIAAPTDVVDNPADAWIYVATQSGVYQFKDNTWTNLGGPGDGEGVELEVDPHDSSRLYLANWNSVQGGLYRFENGNWNRLSDNHYISDVAVSPTDPNLLIATTNQNPYKMSNSAPGMMISRDRGNTWTLDNDGLGVIRAQTVEFSPDGSQVVVGTNGGGFFISSLDVSTQPRAPRNDLNGDGKTDLYWRNYVNGTNIAWFMDNGAFVGSGAGSVLSTDWRAAAMGDFNGDNIADLVWRNQHGGENVIWFSDSNGGIASAKSLPTLGREWKLATTGDFNNDGNEDIVWRHRTSGANVVWYLNNGEPVGAQELQALDSEWHLEASGDFNGDGNEDLVWRNTRNGVPAFWFSDGNGNMVSSQTFAKFDDLSWRFQGSSDFNGDGQSDLLLRNYTTGSNVIWEMNGTTIASGAVFSVVADTNFQVIA